MADTDAKPTSTSSPMATLAQYVKALAWPVIAIVMLCSFWQPLHKIADVLPELVAQSESITVSGVSIKVKKGVADKATPEIREILNKLTATDIRVLLENAEGTFLYTRPSDAAERDKWKHLAQINLATELSKKDLAEKSKEDNSDYDFGAMTTEMYPKVRELVIDFIVQAIADSSTAVKEPATKTKK